MDRSAEKYRSLFEHSCSGLALCRVQPAGQSELADFVILEVNKAFEAMAGRPASELVGRRATELLAPAESSRWIPAFIRVGLSGEPLRMEHYSDTLEKHFDIIAFSPGEGEFVISVQDTTERFQAVSALRRSEERFRGLFDSVPAGVVVIRPDGRILLANRTVQAMMGPSTDPLEIATTGSPRWRLIHEDGTPVEEGEEVWRQTVMTGKACYGIVRGVVSRETAQVRWLVINCEPVFDGTTRELTQIISSFQDITQGRRADHLLSHITKGLSATIGEQYLRKLVEHLSLSLDADYALVGEYNADDRSRIRCQAFFAHGQHIDCVSELSDPLFENKDLCFSSSGVQQLFSNDLFLKRLNVAAYCGMRLLDSSGGPLGLLSVMWKRPVADESAARALLPAFAGRAAAELQRKHAEEAQKQISATLRTMVDDLADARLKADLANKAKSEFLATVSHEIRTPLNAILGITELLASSPLSPQQRADATILQSATTALLQLINDLLDFSKIESGRLQLESIPFSLPDIVRLSAGLLKREAKGKGIDLIYDPDPGMPVHVNGDPARIQQVLLNLLSNAIKFTESGEVRLTYRKMASTGATMAVRFEITDSGIGIPKDVQPKLFEPFVQADVSHTRVYGGTGLGLAICRRLVRAMGGEIGFQSEPGIGSTFWFVVPLETVRETVPQSPKRPGDKAQILRGRRILVAEDNPVNQKVAMRLLEKLGCGVDVAANGREAVDAVSSAHYDAILMDCHMPEMDGFQAARAIRSAESSGNHNGRHCTIIALTADTMTGQREKCLAAGMDDYIAKPISLATLAETLGRHLQ